MTDLRFNFDASFVPPDDAVTDGEAETHSGFTLRGKKWIENALPHLFAHADPCIADRDVNETIYPLRRERQGAALWHRIHGIENDID